MAAVACWLVFPICAPEGEVLGETEPLGAPEASAVNRFYWSWVAADPHHNYIRGEHTGT